MASFCFLLIRKHSKVDHMFGSWFKMPIATLLSTCCYGSHTFQPSNKLSWSDPADQYFFLQILCSYSSPILTHFLRSRRCFSSSSEQRSEASEVKIVSYSFKLQWLSGSHLKGILNDLETFGWWGSLLVPWNLLNLLLWGHFSSRSVNLETLSES